jgi:hypothetical protein
MYKLVLVFALLFSKLGISQTKITWEILSDVKFTDKYSKEVDALYYYPNFGTKVKALSGAEVFLKGYVLDVDPTKSYYILSRHPYASCFFCGSGGPDSIVELKFKKRNLKFSMDQIVTIKGRLKLNADDIWQCNYILEEAEIYSK